MEHRSAMTETETPARSSVEKLEDALAELQRSKGADHGHAVILGTFKAMLPALRKLGYIPDDPDELDAVLLTCAAWCLGMRSDDAWQPETVIDLYLPEPADEPNPEPAPEEQP